VTLARDERRVLARIEAVLCQSDPGLAQLHEAFNRCSPAGRNMARESISPWPPLRARVTRRHVGLGILALLALVVAIALQLGRPAAYCADLPHAGRCPAGASTGVQHGTRPAGRAGMGAAPAVTGDGLVYLGRR